MKVAMCQTNIIWEDKEKNIEKCIEYIEQADMQSEWREKSTT